MRRFHFFRARSCATVACTLGFLCCSLLWPQYSGGADAVTPQVQLDAKKAGPRAVESLTERGIVRDYRVAWNNMALALELNSVAALDGPFPGEAKPALWQSVVSQRRSELV